MSKIAYKPLPQDDPIKRRPDISKARELLNWNPTVGIDEGIEATIQNIIQQSTERMF
jgi:nucleoside-diphosphate-sugar epimerase